MIQVERKLERLDEERKKGVGRDKAEVAREITLFERLQVALSEETALRQLELTPEEERILSGFGFLSRKDLLIVLNLGENQDVPEINFPCQVCVVSLQGKLEMEIAQLSPDDAELFMIEYNISEPSLNRMIRSSYDLMRLQSFFTVGEDEVRAWTVRRGAVAPRSERARAPRQLLRGGRRKPTRTNAVWRLSRRP